MKASLLFLNQNIDICQRKGVNNMGAFICKQPNGLYCRFSTVVDCPTHMNMTRQDVIELYKSWAEEEANRILDHHLRDFGMVEEYFYPTSNMSQEEFAQFMKDANTVVEEEKE